MDALTVAFVTYGVNVGTQYYDAYLTQKGLSNKLAEGNPVTRFLISKLGVAGAGAIKFGAVPFLAFLVPTVAGHPGYAALLNGLIAGVTYPVIVKNVKLLRQNKISIF
jgi:hypothetical protein